MNIYKPKIESHTHYMRLLDNKITGVRFTDMFNLNRMMDK